MAGMSVRLLNSLETNEMFKNDEIFRTILQKGGVTPQALEIIYGGTANAAFTEIGTTATAVFSGGAKEKATILCLTRALTVGGTYFLVTETSSAGVDTTYYVWFSKPEIFTIVCDTRVNTDGGSSFAFTLGATTYYGWFSKYEVFTVQCLAAASITTGTYFTYTDSQGSPTSYYVWMDKNGDGSTDDPAPAGGATGVPCNISGATTADDVATIVAAAINGLAGTGAGAVTDTVTVTMATKGDPTDAVDVDTGFTIVITENGGADPVGTGTGAEFDIKAATTADDVGTIVAAVIDALASSASNSSGTVTVTTTANGNVADAVDVDTGYTITVTEQGGSDPAPSGPTGAECDISGATTADNVATVVQGVLDGLSDMTATVSTATVTVIIDNIGAVNAAVDVDTGFTITQIEIGRDALSGAPLYLVSAQANDDDAIGKNMRKVKVIGFALNSSGVPILKEEEKALSGATRVKLSEILWTHLIHTKGSDWGTAGSDALGNISSQNVDGATSFLLIFAGTNESEGGVIYIPNHFHAMIAEMEIGLHDIVMATAGDGVVVRFVKSGDDETKNNRLYNTDQDNPNISIQATRENPYKKIKWPTKSEIHGTDVAKLTLQEAAINNATDFIFKTYIVLWHKHNTEQDT